MKKLSSGAVSLIFLNDLFAIVYPNVHTVSLCTVVYGIRALHLNYLSHKIPADFPPHFHDCLSQEILVMVM